MRKERDAYTHRTPTQDFPRQDEQLPKKVLVKVPVLIKLSEIMIPRWKATQKPWLIATLQPAPPGLDAVGISKELQLLWGGRVWASACTLPPLPFITSNVPSNKTPPGSSKQQSKWEKLRFIPSFPRLEVVHLTLKSVMCEYPRTWIFEWEELFAHLFQPPIQHRIYFQSIQQFTQPLFINI